MPANPLAILAEFNIPQLDYELQPVSHGLINKSYAVLAKPRGQKLYFLQQIDRNVFKDIEGIMHNISIVSTHFKSLSNAPRYLSTLPARSGTNFFRYGSG